MNRFERIKKLGEGATGSVFKAFDNKTGMLVALKVPEPPPEGVDVSIHYTREIDLLKGLNHEGIVSVVDHGADDGKPWVAYEFLKGHTLRELIAGGKAFSVEESLRIARDIARALQHIHERGIVHRDINPNNIMVTTEGAIKIMDFGIALRPGEPFPRQLAGTPGYMSPETARGEVGGPESDLYSLGLILYELLSRNPAYTGESVPEVIGKVIANDFPELGKRKADIPREIVAIADKALQSKPRDRFQTASEFADAADMILDPKKEEPVVDKKSVSIESPPKLIGIAGPYRGYEVELGPMVTTFGREYADVNLQRDAEISPQHCWIVPEEGAYWLYDAEDSGGTYLTGMAIKRAKLKNGDKMTIGSSTFRWENPADGERPTRNPRDIEYAPMPSRGAPTRGAQQISSLQKAPQYKQASAGGLSPVVRGFVFSIVVIIICGIFYGFVLLPAGETKKVNLALEDYWFDINGELSRGNSEVVISAIRNNAEEYDYSKLETMELSASFFFKLPGPGSARQANLNRITIVIKAMQALKAIKNTVSSSDLHKEIGKYVKEIDIIPLKESDLWFPRKNTILAKLKQIETYLGEKALTEATEEVAPTVPGSEKSVLDKFLEGYYLLTESFGRPSKEIASNAYYSFRDSHDDALDVLSQTPGDSKMKALVVLSDYLMVKLRLDTLTNWAPEYIDDSVYLLTEGRDLLDKFTDAEFVRSVPSEVTDDGYRVKGRLRAKYITLIDQFKRATNADVPESN